jgi:hypothetical protein
VIENEEMYFEAKHIDEDGEYDQTADARNPVPELGSLLVSISICCTGEPANGRTADIRRSPNLFHRSSIV